MDSLLNKIILVSHTFQIQLERLGHPYRACESGALFRKNHNMTYTIEVSVIIREISQRHPTGGIGPLDLLQLLEHLEHRCLF